MTVTEQMTKAPEYAELWRTLMPDCDEPGVDQFGLWAGQYPEHIIVRGVNRAAAKRRKLRDTSRPMTAQEAVRYASSVMKHESLGIRRF